MLEEDTTVDTSVDQLSESQVSGEAQASTDTGESATDTPDAKGESTAESLFDGMTAEQLHKSYKSMQGEYTKLNTSMKNLEAYGSPEQIAQWAGYLQNNPRFAEWVKQEQARSAGFTEDMDEDQQKAFNVVRNLTKQEVEAAINEIRQKEITPLTEKYKNQVLDNHFSAMDKKYEGWRDMKDLMGDLSENLSQQVQDNPEFEDVEDLYFKALRKSGKFDAYAAKLHEKKLKEKKKQSTGEKPTDHSGSQAVKYGSMNEAFAAAKRSVGS